MFNRSKKELSFLQAPDREVVLMPIEKVKTLNVIMVQEDKSAPENMAYIDSLAAEYGIAVKYMVLNHGKYDVPSWYVKDNVTVFNCSHCCSRSGVPDAAKVSSFVKDSADMLFAISDHHDYTLECLSVMSCARFRIGYDRSGRSIYDLSLKYSGDDNVGNSAQEIVSNLKLITTNNEK